jgi:hypothetical protein
MRRFSISLSILVFTLLLVSVCSAQQMSNAAFPNLLGYSGTLNLGLLNDSAQGTPAPQIAIPPRTTGQEKPSNA